MTTDIGGTGEPQQQPAWTGGPGIGALLCEGWQIACCWRRAVCVFETQGRATAGAILLAFAPHRIVNVAHRSPRVCGGWRVQAVEVAGTLGEAVSCSMLPGDWCRYNLDLAGCMCVYIAGVTFAVHRVCVCYMCICCWFRDGLVTLVGLCFFCVCRFVDVCVCVCARALACRASPARVCAFVRLCR